MSIHKNDSDHFRAIASALNDECFNVILSQEILHKTLENDCVLPDFFRSVAEARPNLFSQLPFFLSKRQIERMSDLINAVESVVKLPGFQNEVLKWAPVIAKYNPGPRGVFFGYDFHLNGLEPKLIEINTNAGGALINTSLAKAQRDFCRKMYDLSLSDEKITLLEQNFIEMFLSEWQLQRGKAVLNSIAIVDVNPEQQYLNIEFWLFQRLFQKHGISSVVADPEELVFRDNAVWYREIKIDLIYNRLTDFSLSEPPHAALRDAYLGGHVVITPHPRAHALYADKRNLCLLTDEPLLTSLGVPEATRNILRSCIPHSVLVTSENSELLWKSRRQLFFKPAAGYGSRATYRGDKITRRVWDEILSGCYIAQEIIPPGKRRIQEKNERVTLKVDIRTYVYDGYVQLVAARMYQGQTTNFRTPGGGFTAVCVIDNSQLCGVDIAASGQIISSCINESH